MADYEVRDGLPTVDEIRQACKLLQIPLYDDRMGLDGMTPERQVTVLLAVLSSWLNLYQAVNDYEHDRLTPDEMHMLVASAESEVLPQQAPDHAIAAMNAALWRIQWAAYLMEEIGRSPHALNPADGITAALRCAGLLITAWREGHAKPGFQLDGHTFSTTDPELVTRARHEAREALNAIARIVGPPRKGGKR